MAEWIDGLFVGAHVWWRQLDRDKQNGAGRIYGFVWDTKDNGVVIEFVQEKHIVRYFVSFKALEERYYDGIFLIDTALFVHILPKRELKVYEHIRSLGSIRRNRRRVPVWTHYY